MIKSAYEVAKWLCNPDSEGCTDEEFATVFVWYFNLDKNHLSARNFAEFDVDKAMEYIGDVLKEIIFEDGVVESAWWKQSELFQRIVNERGI